MKHLYLIFFSLFAYADIDVMNADYISKWQDPLNRRFSLERIYHSRSIYNGVFGFGWCTVFDIHLNKSSSGPWTRYECDRQTAASPETTERFDEKGRLIYWRSPGQGALHLAYAPSGLLQSAATGEGLKLRFHYDEANDHIVRIESDSAPPLLFQYADQNLVSVRNPSRTLALYNYSPHHNMTQTQDASGKREAIEYDETTDRVVRQFAAAGHHLQLDYRPGTNPLQFQVKVARWVRGFIKTTSVYVFQYQLLSTGSLVLKSSSRKEI